MRYIYLIIMIFVFANVLAENKPNIVFILADDLGWADLPTYGNQFNEAPNLDQFANEGMRFTNAYAACPVCSPTRASIQSGQYPAHVGVIDFIPGHWRPYEKVIVPKNTTQYLPLEITTIGEAMKAAGYATGYFGKWHLGHEDKYHPLKQGYDEANVGQGFYNVKFKPSRAEGSKKRLSELLADFGEEFIEKHKDEPFFLFLAHYDVHVQLDADVDLIEKYKNKPKVKDYPCNPVYAAMIEHLDRSVGRINTKLKELGLSDNTIVVFFSDNGGLKSRFDKKPLVVPEKRNMFDHAEDFSIATSNLPLKGEKGTLYEGGIREPMIVKWPSKIDGGTVCNEIVSSVDFFPTFLEISGTKLSECQELDGQSISSLLSGKKWRKERSIYWHYPVYHHAEPSSAIRKGNWKLIENLVNGNVELYNLKKDINEKDNLAEINLSKKDELYQLLNDWRKKVGAKLPIANPEFNEDKRYEWGHHPDR